MMKKGLILLVSLTLTLIGFGQETNYNLPPGYTPAANFIPMDLSYKLDGVVVEKDYPPGYFRVLKDLPEDKLLNETSSEYRQYVLEGKGFINSLSQKVKDIYTEEELWYIYAFDQKLKNRIRTVK